MELYYWLRRSKSNPKVGAVTCIIKIDGVESVDLSTWIKVKANNWQQDSKSFIGPDAARLDKALKNFDKRIREIYEEVCEEFPKQSVNPNEIVQRHRLAKIEEKGNRKTKIYFLKDCIKAYVLSQSNLVKVERLTDSSYDVLVSRKKILENYISKNHLERLRGELITELWLENFKLDFMRDGYSDSTIAKYLIFIKSSLIYCRKQKLIRDCKVEDFSIRQPEDKKPVFPTKIELQRLNKAAQNPIDEIVMDIFCFCCYTSLSYSDYNEMTNDNLEIDQDGDAWIYTHRKKTSIPQRIPLLEKPVLDLIQKYGGDLDYLPKLSNSILNLRLKSIAKSANVKKHLNFHSSRKFFISYALNTLHIEKEIIMEIVGWTSFRMFKKYAEIESDTIKQHYKKNIQRINDLMDEEKSKQILTHISQ
jgi:integrase